MTAEFCSSHGCLRVKEKPLNEQKYETKDDSVFGWPIHVEGSGRKSSLSMKL